MSRSSSRTTPDWLGELLSRRAELHPERLAFTFLPEGTGKAEEHASYGDLFRRALAVAGRLVEAGIRPGERALLLYPPGLDFIAAFFGCLYAGVVAVPAYPPRSNDRSQSRLRAIGRDADPRAALATAAVAATAATLVERAPELAGTAFLATDDLGAGVPAGLTLPDVAPGDLAFLQYTSGSTATPKGVQVTHANLMDNERRIGRAFGMGESSVVVGWLPLYHDMGLIGNVLQPLHAGASCVLMSPVSFLKRPRRWLEAIDRFRGTVSGGPNFAYDLCVQKVPEAEREGLDLTSWEVAYNGAEPVRAETLARFSRAFAPCGFREATFFPCYGLAEATLFATGGRRGTPPRQIAASAARLEQGEARPTAPGESARHLVSSGRAEGLKVAVVDAATGEELPEGRVGEIWLAGPSVAAGYWNRPEASAETFGARLADGEGPFLRTGDLGCLWQGELYVTGRQKDLIILRGRNHYPQDLERTAEAAHPDLRAGCGAAFPVEVDGEERLVLVQEVERRRQRQPEGFADIAAAVRQAVAEEHEVAVWDVVLIREGTLLKTSSGKVQRRAMREAYRQGALVILGRSALGGDGENEAPGEPGGELTREDLLHLPAETRPAALLVELKRRAAEALRLPVSRVSTARGLTGQGLDSLSAIELKGQVEEDLGLSLPLSDLLEGASLEDLTAALGLETLTPSVPLSRDGRGGSPHPSYGQRSLWFLERLAPAGGAYNIAVAARSPAVDGEALRDALTALVLRHDALRTVLPLGGEEPGARLLERGFLDYEVLDAAGWSEGEIAAHLTAETWQPFDLAAGPLVRLRFLRQGNGGALLLAIHHVAVDFQSLVVLARELAALLSGDPLPPPAASYGELAGWQETRLAGPRGDELQAYWQAELAGLPDLDLPTDRPRPPVQTYRGGAALLRPAPETTDLLARLAAERGATPFTALLAAFAALLGRYAGQDDFAIGAPTSGRPGPRFANTVGYFVNPMAVRADLSGEPSFLEHLERTRHRVVAGLEHADYPFPLLAEHLLTRRDPARHPLFQATFVLQGAGPGDQPGLGAFGLGIPGVPLWLGPLELHSLPFTERRVPFDLTLKAAPEGRALLLCLEHNADLHDEATAARLLGHLENLLEAAAADPERPIADLPLLSPAERHQLLHSWNVTTVPLPADLAGRCLHEIVAAQAIADPQAEALLFQGQRLTRGELDGRASSLAQALRAAGIGPEIRAGVCLPRTPDLVISLLAVLKAGGAYVPLDPVYPAERLAFMLEDAGASLLITTEILANSLAPEAPRIPLPGGLVGRALPFHRAPVGGADGALPRRTGEGELFHRLLLPGSLNATSEPARRGRAPSAGWSGEIDPGPLPWPLPRDGRGEPASAVVPGNLAYVIYTSGSTGRPKGVAIEHQSAVALVAWARRHYSPEELAGTLAATSVSFDVSAFEIWAPLALGGRLLLADNILALPNLHEAAEARLVAAVPSAMAELAQAGKIPPSVTTVNLGGEPVPPSLPAEILATSQVTRIWNCYGPTEDSTYSTVTSLVPGGDVTIGQPIDNGRLYLLDARGEPVPLGVPGEIHLAGAGLARGYLGHPDATAARYLPDPFGGPGERLYRTGDLARRRADGRVDYLGRLDFQVKVRGFRVEPGEIETALYICPGVAEAAVIARPGPGGGTRLLAYVAPAPGRSLAAPDLRTTLAGYLPAYMVPLSLTILAALPRTPNGKIDRHALPDPEPAPAAGRTRPRNDTEKRLAAIWSDVLGLAQVGIDDDFFELGGHSLLATRVLSRVARELGTELPVTALFTAPTVARLASLLTAAGPALLTVPTPEAPQGPPLSFGQQRLWFLSRLDPGSVAYNLTAALALTGPLHEPALATALAAIVRRHEPLRTVFGTHEGEPVQVITPGPVPFLTADLTALPDPGAAADATLSLLDETPFDLNTGPMARFALLRLAPESHRLAVSLHHAAADGWSVSLFFRELAALYAAALSGEPAPLPPLPLRYADYATGQQRDFSQGVWNGALAAWRERLAGLPVLELPADRPRPAMPSHRGFAVRFALDGDPAAGLRRFAAASGATLYMALLAGFGALLARLSGQSDFAVGVPVAGRTDPRSEGLIGFFVNTLPVRLDLAGSPSGRELLGRARRALVWAKQHQEVPFEKLVAELQPERTRRHAPLAQVLLAFLAGEPPPGLPGIASELLDREPRTAKVDLSLTLYDLTTPGGGAALSGWLDGSRDLFDRPTLTRFAACFGRLLESLAAAPDRPVDELPLLSEAERHQLVTGWNDTAAPVPEASWADLFARQAAATPDRVAIVAPEGSLTYAELESRANRLAHKLVAHGAGPDVPVALCLPRSAAPILALLAALKAGSCYLPLDPAHPPARLAHMLEDSGAALVVTMRGTLPDATLPEGRAVVLLDTEALADAPETAPGVTVDGDHLAYLIYTSGSTGLPKGTLVRQKSVASLVVGLAGLWKDGARAGLSLAGGAKASALPAPSSTNPTTRPLSDSAEGEPGPPLRLTLNASLSFDASVQQLVQLSLGHTLIALPEDVRRDGARLAAFMAREALDGFDCTPTQLEMLLAAGGTLPAHVWVGGEPISPALWQELASRPRTRAVNLYGPTECTVDATAGLVTGSRPLLGRPLPNHRVYVLDPRLEPQPLGVAGEICLGGAGVSRGYAGRPGLTADRFVPDPHAWEPGARLYRTGDRGRFLPDGRLEHLGRLDEQIKLRGFRIEPGEIEATLRAHPGVREAAVAVRDDGAGPRLVAYLVGEMPPDPRPFLRERLPEYMVPAQFVGLDALPLSPNGKLDRKALPAPPAESAAGIAEPATPTETVLATLWSDLLHRPHVGRDADFFALGGHSLLATRLAVRVRDALGVELSLSDFFAQPRLADLAAWIDARRGPETADATAEPLRPVPRPDGTAPLSSAQSRLWFLWELEPASPRYNLAGALRLSGRLDTPALARALTALAARHEVLRTVFPRTAHGPVQRILPAVPVPLPVADLSRLPGERAEAEARRLLTAEAVRPFDLMAGPVLRTLLVRLSPTGHRLAVTLHHAVADGWSLAVMRGELSALYRACSAGSVPDLPPLPVQYADFAVWQRDLLASGALDGQLAAWKAELAGAPPLELPADRPRPSVASGRGAALPFTLPAATVEELSRRFGATPFMVLAAAFAALLARYTGQDDLTLGTPVANRERREVEGLIGCFVNALPLRLLPRAAEPFAGFLTGVRRTALAAYERQAVPFERLVEELSPARDRSRTPLFDIVLAFQNVPREALEMAGVELAQEELPTGTAKFDLTLLVEERGGEVAGTAEWSTDLFDHATVLRLTGHLCRLLEGAHAAPEAALGDLPLLGDEERREVLSGWHGPAEGPRPAASIPALVAARLARTPAAVAVLGKGESLTCGELGRRAAGVARHLRRSGVGPEARVGVCLGRDLRLIPGLLGVLAAGGAYVPLDPAYPQERLDFLLADSGAAVLLTDERLAERFAGFPGTVLCIDEIPPADDPALPVPALSPDSLAYLIYTSGSTGAPKAVAISHGSAVARLAWARGFYSDEELAGVFAGASVAFDISVFEIFAPLAWGGRVILGANALELPDHPEAGEVRLFEIVPSVMAELSRRTGLPGSVVTVNLPGEPLKGAVVAQVFASFPAARRAVNLYGPSEDTTFSTAAEIRPGFSGEPDVGRPLPGTRAYLLDARGLPVPRGVPGELWLGGAGVSRGYLGRPDLTAARYVPDALSGLAGGRLYRTGDLARHLSGGRLDVLGRLDQQVKVRGFRIELGEIEAALARHPAVLEAAAAVRDDLPSGRGVVAYVVPHSGAALAGGAPLAELRPFLAASLPEHLLPAAFVALAGLPLSPNGKVDRRRLPPPAVEEERATPVEEAPHGPVEELLAGLFADLLGLPAVGAGTSFFDLGGHSLLVTRLASRVREVFDVELPLAAFFDAPSVRELGREIAARRAAGGPGATAPVVPVPRDGSGLPLSFAQERLWFLERFLAGSPVYNIPLAVRLTGALDGGAFAAALAAVVGRHEALRATFPDTAGTPRQRLADVPGKAAPLPLVDLAGLPPERREAAAAGEARGAARLPFDLAAGPLLRTFLVRLAPDDHLLALTLHHIVSDGWSMGVLLRDLGAFYEAARSGGKAVLPPLPVQYADFAVWQREWLAGEDLERELAFQRRRLAPLPEPLELPADRPRPAVQSFRGRRLPLAVAAPLAASVEELARRSGATPFMVLLAAFSALLSRLSGRSRFTVGLPVAGRNRREVEELVGFFVNLLVIAPDLAGEPAFAEVVARVRRQALEAFDHQDLPFEKLVLEMNPARDTGHPPLAQVVFSLRDNPFREGGLPGLALRFVDQDTGVSRFDLTLGLGEAADGLAGEIEYSADLFDAPTAARFAGGFLALLAEGVARPGRPFADLPLLSPAERQQLLVEWADLRPLPPARLLHQAFEARAARDPGSIALVNGERRLTCGELDAAANRLARRLQVLGVGPEVPVGLCLERSADLVVALYAVLKAGGAYLPLDPTYPPERLARMVEDARAPLVLTRQRFVAGLPIAGTMAALDLAAELAAAQELPATPPPCRAVPGNLAYLIYTSGSTGRPKGVAIEHRSAAALLAWARERYSDAELAGVLASTSLNFDMSVFELFAPLALGGTAILADNALHLPRLAAAGEVTLLDTVPAAAAELLESGSIPPSVRTVNLGGEALPPKLARDLLALGTVERVVNLYGPSEDTTFSTFASVERDGAVTIGRPVLGTAAYVVDGELRPLPLGVAGELYLGGAGLTRGYLGRPDLTAARFVPDPLSGEPGARLYRTGDLVRFLPDGRLDFLGRLDHQVKVRGFRIELGEIEAVLAEEPRVRQAAVVVQGEGEARRLAAFVVPAPSAAGPELLEALKEAARAALPGYMVPARFDFLEELPRTGSGKIDRRNLALLPADGEERPKASLLPRTPTEEGIAAIWSELLGRQEISVTESFFDLGGYSLLTLRLVSRLEERFGVQLPLQEMFADFTIAGLAERVDEALVASSDAAKLDELLAMLEAMDG